MEQKLVTDDLQTHIVLKKVILRREVVRGLQKIGYLVRVISAHLKVHHKRNVIRNDRERQDVMLKIQD